MRRVGRGTAVRTLGAGALLVVALAGCGGRDGASSAKDTTVGESTPVVDDEPTTTAVTRTTPTPPDPSAAGGRRVVIVVDGGRPRGGIRQIEVKQGERLVILVRADAGESVHLHGYDLEQPVRAGRPARMTVSATIPGRFEVELHEPDALLARLVVRP